MPFDEDDCLPISALQHFLFCERRSALIHIEGLWANNRYTVEGDQLHTRVDDPGASENLAAAKIVRSLGLCSLTHGLTGKADLVEFHRTADGLDADYEIHVVEYKRGRHKAKLDLPYQVQLCAQALCIEDMLRYQVTAAFLYFGMTRRRVEVPLDASLRQTTADTITRLHAQIASGKTPLPIYKPKKCKACSLVDLCLPTAPRPRTTARKYLRSLFDETDQS